MPELYNKPEILAPAGNRDMFLAALAAGADSVYCGLKHFSARMEAENFTISELAGLRELAEKHGCRTYCAMNTLVKPGELQAAGRLLDGLIHRVRPQALIIQDLALIRLARELGFQGELHLSTLANPGTLLGMELIGSLGIKRLVLPRELNLEEIKRLAASCPQNLELETFVHGALCYGVSGRCYWSSWLGGKSGLRGRCVQPCRRLYTAPADAKRFFSCQDLSLDVLSKPLLQIPQISAWKIEGRKKGPHYVFYVTKAYRLLRDHPGDGKAKKLALDLLEQCLGRTTTHSTFLPQKPHNPVQEDKDTGSGLFVSKLGKTPKNVFYIRPRTEILPGDLLRVGYQDQPGHLVIRIKKYVSKGARLNIPKQNKDLVPGTAVFLIDRREQELKNLLNRLSRELFAITPDPEPSPSSGFQVRESGAKQTPKKSRTTRVYPEIPVGKLKNGDSVELTPARSRRLSKTLYSKLWFWLPPVIWPEEEPTWKKILLQMTTQGAVRFVTGSPWQISLFNAPRDLEIWAGPFCNLSNWYAASILKELGFKGTFVSPELERDKLLDLPRTAPLPLGIVLSGSWPLCISRFLSPGIKPGQIIKSPKQELSFVVKQGQNYLHFPNWELDLSAFQIELEQAGYTLFAHLFQPRPPQAPQPRRTSTFNWDLRLL
ncbi:MAG: U32 family peptidase [Desulfohalobiaceae bacterium]|nr:U32 family peptidase [Desulfohalobiaceae bacterium]